MQTQTAAHLIANGERPTSAPQLAVSMSDPLTFITLGFFSAFLLWGVGAGVGALSAAVNLAAVD